MKVVIVAKTRMGGGACVGAISFDGRSLRLIAPDADTNDHFNMEYNVGEVWDIEGVAAKTVIPPHVENFIVHRKRRLPQLDNLISFIEHHISPHIGGIELLYEGLTQATTHGALYIAERTGIPACSTLFWRPDQPLTLDDSGQRLRYRYPTADGGRTLTFVGFQEPIAEIPAGTLLRVSLAHWWRPPERPEQEPRCHVQLSGWFFPVETDFWFDERELYSEEAPLPTVASLPTAAAPVPWPELSLVDAQAKLKRVFGYDSFRPLQAEVIDNLLQKRDSLAIMPTGSGKSLCFQLPALLFPGLTVVVSPLIALMEDQVEQLRELGVPAAFLNSTVAYSDYLVTTDRIRSGEIKLLYAAPETLLRPETLMLLDHCQVNCLTIDEAHCISEWGHDFRPEYRQLVALRRRLPQAVCLALTATATPRVRHDIKESLEIGDADEFVASFNRENLFLAVERKRDGLAQTLEFIRQRPGQSGIIYCSTRAQVDELAAALLARGLPVFPYHAGMDDQTRREHQHRFTHDEGAIMVATIAFGMGINKSNVRFILHYDLPKNPDSYYQQIGRAGRDGLRADCLLLFSQGDVRTINYFIAQQDPSQQAGARERLRAMLDFAKGTGCRRRPLLAYFGESMTATNCGMCDNCITSEQTISAEELVDLTIPAQKFLSCVKRTGELFGISYIIDVLRGSRSKRVLQRGHDRLSTYNIGREYSAAAWQELAHQFIELGLLVQDAQFGSLKLTAEAYAVFKGKQVMGRPPDKPQQTLYAASKTRPVEIDYDLTLFERLREKRRELAADARMPPYVIFSDRTLVEMAAYFPQSRESLAKLTGVGEVKLEKYAADFLPLIRAYCQENGITEKPKAAAPPPPVSRSHSRGLSRSEEIAEMYNSGRSIPEIAETEVIQVSTVLNHLWKYGQQGGKLRIDGLLELSELTTDEQQDVLDAFAAQGTEHLRPVFEALGEAISYDELRILRLYYLSLQAEDRKMNPPS